MNINIENFNNILNIKKADAILISSKSNKIYINALTGSGVKVLITKEKVHQIMDGRYINEAEKLEANFINIVYGQGENYIDSIKKILGNDKKILIEGSNTLIKEYFKFKDSSLNIELLDDELEFQRRIKSKEEIEKVKKACEITDEIFSECLSEIKIGMTERELGALIQYLALKKGAQGMAFETIVASGVRGAMPHGRPTNKKIVDGELITIDFGVIYEGYQSDMTRTIGIGKVNKELQKIYKIVLESQREGIKFIKSGIKGKDVDSHVRNIIESYGYGKYFTHGLGHGIGIGTGEFPILNKSSEMILEEGMIMSCEPGIYIPNLGGVRIEDDVVIRDGQGISLNRSSKELIILEGK